MSDVAMATELLPVVRGDDDEGVFFKSETLELFEQLADDRIGIKNLSGIGVFLDNGAACVTSLLRAFEISLKDILLGRRRVGAMDLVGVKEEEKTFVLVILQPIDT